MMVFLRCIAKAAANAAGGGIAGDLVFDVLPEVAEAAWKWWAGERNPEQRKDDLAQVAAATPEQVKLEAKDLVLEFAPDSPRQVQEALTAYLALVPGQVQKSLRRPSDPQGKTVTFDLVPRDEKDILKLLPGRLPRYKAGEYPLPGIDWELEELLGVGGFGEVWKAKNPHMPSLPPVALKFCVDASAAQYLRHEAGVLGQVMRQGKHPGIVALQQTYLRHEVPCLEYEYVHGGDLAGLIQQWHRSSDEKPDALEITCHFLGLCEIIAFAHSQLPPIVHRDLKPANVLRQIGPDGQWAFKVTDFGIGGLATQEAARHNTRGTSRGLMLVTGLCGSCTPLYASPQQARGERPDPRDDVYSLGVIWYQMLLGDTQAPAPSGSRWQRRLVDGGLPQPFADVLADCVEPEPQDRIPDARALAERLGDLLPERKSQPCPDVQQKPKARPEKQPRPRPGLVMPSPTVIVPPPEPPRPAPKPPTWEREQAKKKRDEELVLQLADLNAKVARQANDAVLLATRGEVLRQLGKQADAIADCTQAVLLNPSLAGAYATRGSAYRLKGELELAIADCTRALELDARCLLAWYNRAEAYRLKNELEKAIRDCTRALEIDPGHSWAYGTRGAAKRQKGDLAGAVDDLNETLRLDPFYVWAWAVRGETHRLLGDFGQAIADCTEALRLDPQNYLALATRGAAFRQQGDFPTAQQDLENALRLSPNYEWARQQLALARRRQR